MDPWSMIDAMKSLGAAIAVVAALVSAAFAILGYWLSLRSSLIQAHREIGECYNRLLAFRSAHPEVLGMSRDWQPKHLMAAYGQAPSDRRWDYYHIYVELCIGFCNAVEYAKRRGALDTVSYDLQYLPLVKLLLTEHYPCVSTLLSGDYVSPMLRDLVTRQEIGGWRWQEQHRELLPEDK